MCVVLLLFVHEHGLYIFSKSMTTSLVSFILVLNNWFIHILVWVFGCGGWGWGWGGMGGGIGVGVGGWWVGWGGVGWGLDGGGEDNMTYVRFAFVDMSNISTDYRLDICRFQSGIWQADMLPVQRLAGRRMTIVLMDGIRHKSVLVSMRRNQTLNFIDYL